MTRIVIQQLADLTDADFQDGIRNIAVGPNLFQKLFLGYQPRSVGQKVIKDRERFRREIEFDRSPPETLIERIKLEVAKEEVLSLFHSITELLRGFNPIVRT